MDKLKEKLDKAEGMLCGLILKELETLNDYNINPKLLSEAGLFYVGIAKKIQVFGNDVVDEVNFSSMVENLKLTDKFIAMGGYNTIKELTSIIDVRNSDSIVDEFTKWNLVKRYKEKGILDLDKHWDKINQMTSGQVADYIEYQINDIDISVGSDLIVEDLNFTDKEIEDTLACTNMGIQFSKHSPILNNLMLGLPTSDLTMFASYSGGGKSSYIMNNIVIPIAEQKIKSVIISNAMKAITYKQLLQTYVLTERCEY